MLSRTHQLRKERKEKVKQQQVNLEDMLKEARQKVVFDTTAKGGPSTANQQLAMLDPNRLPDLRAKVRFNLPKTLRAENTSDMVIERETLQNELNQGIT